MALMSLSVDDVAVARTTGNEPAVGAERARSRARSRAGKRDSAGQEVRSLSTTAVSESAGGGVDGDESATRR